MRGLLLALIPVFVFVSAFLIGDYFFSQPSEVIPSLIQIQQPTVRKLPRSSEMVVDAIPPKGKGPAKVPMDKAPKSRTIAPSLPSKPGGPSLRAQAVITAYHNLKRLEEIEERISSTTKNFVSSLPFYRYFYVPPFGDPKDPKAVEEYEDFLVAFKVHLNLLSRQGAFGTPVIVSPSVLRIDVRDFAWDKLDILTVYEKLGEQDFFFHMKEKALAGSYKVRLYWPGGFNKTAGERLKRGRYSLRVDKGDLISIPSKTLPAREIDYLRSTLYTEAPILNAVWFKINTETQNNLDNEDVKTGYYDFLGIKDRKGFFDLIGLKEKDAQDRFAEFLAIVEQSGVSEQNRQLGRLQAITGAAWFTLDTFKQRGRGEATAAIKRGEFVHEVEEWYSFLFNHLWVTFLSDKAGVRQATAPDKLGPDKSAPPQARRQPIDVNLSCMRCHGTDKEMLKPVDDFVRNHFSFGKNKPLLADPSSDDLRVLQSQYLRSLDRELDRDRRMYMEALAEVTVCAKYPKGLTSTQFTKVYCNVRHKYLYTRLDLERASWELGFPKEMLVKGLLDYQKAKGRTEVPVLVYLAEKPGSLTRLSFENFFNFLEVVAYNIAPADLIEKIKPERFEDKKGK